MARTGWWLRGPEYVLVMSLRSCRASMGHRSALGLGSVHILALDREECDGFLALFGGAQRICAHANYQFSVSQRGALRLDVN